jgi:hypothetical protein
LADELRLDVGQASIIDGDTLEIRETRRIGHGRWWS